MKRLLALLIIPFFLFGCHFGESPRTDVQKTRVDFPPPIEYPPPVVWVWAKNVTNDTVSVVYYRGDFVSTKTNARRWTRIIRCDFSYLEPNSTKMTRCTFVGGRPSDYHKEGDTLKVNEIKFNQQ